MRSVTCPPREEEVPVRAIHAGVSKLSSLELMRAMESLGPDDPARALALLALDEENPALCAAIVRRLVSEIHAERE